MEKKKLKWQHEGLYVFVGVVSILNYRITTPTHLQSCNV